jgi:hypothetical protein
VPGVAGGRAGEPGVEQASGEGVHDADGVVSERIAALQRGGDPRVVPQHIAQSVRQFGQALPPARRTVHLHVDLAEHPLQHGVDEAVPVGEVPVDTTIRYRTPEVASYGSWMRHSPPLNDLQRCRIESPDSSPPSLPRNPSWNPDPCSPRCGSAWRAVGCAIGAGGAPGGAERHPRNAWVWRLTPQGGSAHLPAAARWQIKCTRRSLRRTIRVDRSRRLRRAVGVAMRVARRQSTATGSSAKGSTSSFRT